MSMADDDRLLMFSYGSNTATSYLRDYCPSAEPVMRAVLPNFWIQFRRYSTDLNGGISTIMETPGDMVRGMLFSVPGREIDELDILEDVPIGLYIREGYMVLGEDNNWYNAQLYRVANPEGPFPPSRQYVAYMIEGAKEQGQPADYIARIEAFQNDFADA